MKSILTLTAAGSLFAALAMAQPQHYTLTDLGPVGGAPGQAFSVASNGLAAGAAAVSNGMMHATLWYQGMKADIGTPGFGAQNSVAFSVNQRGQAVGESESLSALNPTDEDFCGFKAQGLLSKGVGCVPFLWEYGVMTPLPTLGGSSGAANLINNRGVVAGVAETSVRDPGCPAPQVLQFKPVIWDREGVHELPTASGDPDGVAFSINDNGQVAGASGDCSTFSPQTLVNLQPLHALLWDTGTVTDLGNLGGTGHGMGIVALNLNNQGEVVGESDLPGDQAFHGFLWSRDTGMKDLGTLPGDAVSAALNINNRGEVIGVSLDANFNPRAFVWQNGTMTDLNTLVPADSPLALLLACGINNRGEIVGFAVDKSTGESHAFLASPGDGAAGSETTVGGTRIATRPRALSEDARKLIQQLRFGRLGAVLGGPR